MKVIPVIDTLNGVVVHAVRGKRQEYQPLTSILTKSVDPIEVANVFQMCGFSELYIADLDAITKGIMNFQALNRITDETDLRVMVDAGVADLETAEKLLGSGVSKIVIGTETLKKKGFVGKVMKNWGKDRVVVSLDFKGNEVLVKLGFEGRTDPLCLLREFARMGVNTFIILDLARVGSCEGVNLDFLKKALEEDVNVCVGGGVRDINDLIELRELGVSGVLVATALHSGRILIEELKENKML